MSPLVDQDETVATAGDASELAAVIRARRVDRDRDNDAVGHTTAADSESPLGTISLLFLFPLLVAALMAAQAGPGYVGVWTAGTAASVPRIPDAAVVHSAMTTTSFATITATSTLSAVAVYTITPTSTAAVTSETTRTVTVRQDWTTMVLWPFTTTAYSVPTVTHTVNQALTTVREYTAQVTVTSTIYQPPVTAYKYWSPKSVTGCGW
ncbi:hypothetical protein AMAG_19088 [Allomyces macrogynus ATCC 38327]|uniref:Uncharacterized protein n=1 Tax=Allomyces macrogynus (strain ATCC 38327) TaxID=578462 RepID=A0A0L0SN20_ALLM3|nr:hypothetical protein AMAG_19088 [Allomyces macrogynus ATCC 38327]|eukprot:KNE63898.1 hypothetical protein AMAG_19088 [Allomyces macrogynus ATCC 38327]